MSSHFNPEKFEAGNSHFVEFVYQRKLRRCKIELTKNNFPIAHRQKISTLLNQFSS
jgi:hypothetical protein